MGDPINFIFGSRVGFSGTADRTALFPVRSDPRWRLTAILKISNGHISATGHPIHFVFDSVVGFWGMADRMALLPVGSHPRWRPAILDQFKIVIYVQRFNQCTSYLFLGRETTANAIK